MGPRYSKPVADVPQELDELTSMTLLDVKTKYVQWCKSQPGRRVLFLSRETLQRLFGLSDPQIYRLLALLSPHQVAEGPLNARCNSWELWGALALASSGSFEEKLRFCFQLADLDADQRLSFDELVVLVLSVTRGLARLKGLELVPESAAVKLAVECFAFDPSAHSTVSVDLFLSYVLSGDDYRYYMEALGSKVPPVDANALVQRRWQVLRRLADNRFSEQQTLQGLEEIETSQRSTDDRGGDSQWLSLQGEEPPSRVPERLRGEWPPDQTLRAVATEAELAADLPASHPVRQFLLEEDSWRNEIYRDVRASTATFSAAAPRTRRGELRAFLCSPGFEQRVTEAWHKLPQEEDGLVHLDERTLQTLLFLCDLSLSVGMAKVVLRHLPRCQRGRHSLAALLNTLRFDVDLTADRYADWRRLRAWADEALRDLLSSTSRGLRAVLRQRRVVAGWTQPRLANLTRRLQEFRSQLSRSPASHSFLFSLQPDKLRSFKAKWSEAREKDRDKGKEEQLPWGLRLDLTLQLPALPVAASVSGLSSRLRLIERLGYRELGIAEGLDGPTAADLLGFYNTSEARDVPFQSCAWLGLSFQPQADEAQRLVVRSLVERLATSAPASQRLGLSVRAELCSLDAVEAPTPTPQPVPLDLDQVVQASRTAARSAREQSPGRLLLLVFLSASEPLTELEKELFPADLFVSRALHRVDFSLRLVPSLQELLEQSQRHCQLASQLFGPQEEQLNEEQANPLRYAKELRRRRTGLEQQLNAVPSASAHDLKTLLRGLGRSDRGQLGQLRQRAAEALRSKLDLLGHGELSESARRWLWRLVCEAKRGSAPGRDEAQGRVEEVEESRGLALWEVNHLLHSLRLPVFYDKNEYGCFVEEHGLLADSSGQLCFSGLCAYYEQRGGLGEELIRGGAGSVSEAAAGEVMLQLAVEPAAAKTWLRALGTSRLRLPGLAALAGLAGCVRETRWSGELLGVDDLLLLLPLPPRWTDRVNRIVAWLRTPGQLFRSFDWWSEMSNDEGQLLAFVRNSLGAQGPDPLFDHLLLEVAASAGTEEDVAAAVDRLLHQSLLGEALRAAEKRGGRAAELMADLLFLHGLRGQEALGITLAEGETLERRKQWLEEQLRGLDENEAALATQWPALLLACYDAARLFLLDVRWLGVGGSEGDLSLRLRGLTLLPWLVPGRGEPSPSRLALQQKEERLRRRRQAALAALQRERLRREVTAEEAQAAEHRAQLQARRAEAQKEVALAAQALEELREWRESRRVTTETQAMVRRFEELARSKEVRAASTLDAAVAKNNLAVALAEVYGLDHPLSQPAVYLLEEAAKLALQGCRPEQLEDEPPREEEEVAEEQRQRITGQEEPEPGSEGLPEAATRALLILNYLEVLAEAEDELALCRSFPIKEFFVRCLQSLRPRQRDKLSRGVVPALRGVAVLSFQPQHLELLLGLEQEVNSNSLSASLDPRITLDSKPTAHPTMAESEAATAKTTTARKIEQREARRDKYARQRAKDQAKRREVGSQRNFLYQLIQSDEISRIFAHAAQGEDALRRPSWGAKRDEALEAGSQRLSDIARSRVDDEEDDDIQSER